MRRILILISLIALMIGLSSIDVKAVTITSAPYDTYTVGPNGRRILTQTAYEPAGIINPRNNLNNPSDMYLKDDYIYVADTGNKRIVKMDLAGNFEVLIENLSEPTGVHVDEDNFIYVADKGDMAVKKYQSDGTLIESFGRPEEPIFGKNTVFIPTRVTTGPRGIIYVTGEGSTGGVMQLNHVGEFLGFYGTNPTYSSFYRKVLEFFDVSLARIIPVPPENLAIDSKGSVYTTSRSTDGQLKKFNISSSIVLELRTNEAPVAVAVNDFDNIYSITTSGIINEYDSYGNLIFSFGGVSSDTNVLGTFVRAQDIVVDSNYNLYILDQATGYVQVLQRSEFTKLVHDGLISFKNGIYDIDQWQNVLRMNSVFALANSSIARAEYRLGNYEEALEYYYIASDRAGYSDAYWQMRYVWLQQNLGIVFIALIAFLVLKKGLKIIDQKYQIYEPIRDINHELKKVKVLNELRLLSRMIKHPIDTFYELKHNKRSSYLAAHIIYLIALVLTVVSVYLTGFIFNYTDTQYYNIFSGMGLTLGVIVLFVLANYMISTLSSGEGWFKDVYIGTAYALAPYIFLTIPIILLSRVLTLNESFIYNALVSIRTFWVLILVVLMVKETHNYTLKQLIKNLLLTIFTMVMILVMLILLYLLVTQLFDYIIGIIREVILRA